MAVIKLVPGLFALLRMRNERVSRIKAAPPERKPDPISDMARAMHPEELRLVVRSVVQENETVRTYRLEARVPVEAANGRERMGAPSRSSGSGSPILPVFQPGQYISVKLKIQGCQTSRAYTIASAPREAEYPREAVLIDGGETAGAGLETAASDGAPGFYEITVRRKPGGFVSGYIWDTWKAGTEVAATGPHGDFHYSPLRDTAEIVALAGGTGITPFRSMIRQWAGEGESPRLTLLYGCRDTSDELFSEDIAELCRKHPDRFRRINTYEKVNGDAGLRQGYLDAGFISEHVGDPAATTFFICGPTVMYRFLREEFARLGDLERKQTRFEACGAPDDVTRTPGFPTEAKGRSVSVSVRIGNSEQVIPAASTENLLVSIERAGLILDSRCRSGECGICRSRLVSGEVFILPDNDGRRAADRELGYIHPCSTYPLTDLTVEIPPGKAAQT